MQFWRTRRRAHARLLAQHLDAGRLHGSPDDPAEVQEALATYALLQHLVPTSAPARRLVAAPAAQRAARRPARRWWLVWPGAGLVAAASLVALLLTSRAAPRPAPPAGVVHSSGGEQQRLGATLTALVQPGLTPEARAALVLRYRTALAEALAPLGPLAAAELIEAQRQTILALRGQLGRAHGRGTAGRAESWRRAGVAAHAAADA